MLNIIKGNIFTSKCQTIVNTVNCVGVMGAGIAYEYRLRYPEMYAIYKRLCENQSISIGKLWLYKAENRWILNFPTKISWKGSSSLEYLELGLKKFLNSYEEKEITSIAFPILGASLGGLSEMESLKIMDEYLSLCKIPIEIYQYDKYAVDDMFIKFKEIFYSMTERSIAEKSELRIDFVKKIKKALDNSEIKSINRLLTIPGIGEQSLEKCFRFVMNYEQDEFSLKL